MAGEIKRSDIIEDDALMAPLILSKNFEVLLATILKLKAEVGANLKLAETATNVNSVNTAIKGLAKQETELVKIQNQLATAVAKDNEEFANYKKKVDEANAAVKTRIELGDKDAKTIDKQNASLKQLQAALNKNRQEYAKLNSEQERNSKSGQALLKTIQHQDKGVKELNQSMGKFTDNVGNYTNAMQGLDGATNGAIGRFQALGKQFLAILSNPIVAVIAALVASFYALNNAVNTYYTTSAEGEEMMQKRQATWDAFFLTLKQGWASVGEAVSEFFGEDGLKGLLYNLLFTISPALAGMFAANEAKLTSLSKLARQLIRDHAADVVDDANTELKANKLIEISRNKLDYDAAQRMEALKAANALRRDQLAGDIQLAKDDLRAFDERILAERKGGKLLEEDITKRAQLEAALIKVQSDASAARTGFLKLEKALADEIHNDEIKKLQEVADASLAKAQQGVENEIQLIRDKYLRGEIIKKDADARILAITRANAAALIQAQIDGLTVMMNAAETNAEEDIAIAKHIAKLKIDLNKAVYDSVIELGEATVEEGKGEIEKLSDIYKQFAQSLGNLFGAFSDRRTQQIDDDLAKLEESTAMQIKLAGDNDAAVEAIEKGAEQRREQLEKKKRADQQRGAKNDKIANTISSIMNTAVAVTKALPNIPLAILTGVLGAIQTAAIVAQPIPQFFKGTDNAPEGFALVGEKGSELKIEPSGKASLTPAVPTVDYLKAGTRIIPHEETMKRLALAGMGSEDTLRQEQSHQLYLAASLRELQKENKENTKQVVKAIKANRPGNLYREGSLVYEGIMDDNGNRKLIRRSNLIG